MILPSGTMEVRFERIVAAGPSVSYGVGNGDGGRFIAPAGSGSERVQQVDRDRCIALPEGLATERAIVLPRLVTALWAWDVASLEPGEAAIVTSGSACTGELATVAAWRSGRRLTYLDCGDGPTGIPADGLRVDAAEPQQALATLARQLDGAPGAIAVVATPNSEAIDLLLEAMPVWGRIVLAIDSTEPAAVDFYNNVHRKGLRICGAPASPACVFDPSLRHRCSAYILRAARILQNERLAARCLPGMT